MPQSGDEVGCAAESFRYAENPPVNANEFIAKWHASELKERSTAQEHFIDLCRLLGEPTPAEADPKGHHYCPPLPVWYF